MRIYNRQHKSIVSGVPVGLVSDLYWMPPKPPRTQYVVGVDTTQIVVARTVRGIQLRPRFENDTRNGIPRTYCTGAWNVNLVITEHMKAEKMGILAPNMKPAVVAGAGTISGSFVPYYRYVDGWTGRFGPLSTPGDLLTLPFGGAGRQWNNIPQETDILDDSVTHIQGLVDDGSGVARVVWTKEVGAPATYLDNVATLSLGQAAPPSFQALPTLRCGIAYHDVFVGFGNAQFPERLFISALGEFEHWEGTFVATNGEPIVGVFATDDVIMFGSFQAIYRTQGFVGTDFGRTIEKPDIGFIGPDGFANIHGRIIAPTSGGIMLYDGAWHSLMSEDMESAWKIQLQANPQEYRDAQGFYDVERNVYTFGPVPWTDKTELFEENSKSIYWVLDCRLLYPGSEGRWRSKWRLDHYGSGRLNITKAVWYSPTTGVPLIPNGGAADGMIREENYLDTAGNSGFDDDGVNKVLIIEPAYIAAVQGGLPDDGARWQLAWSYAESTTDWYARWKAGNQLCYRATNDFSFNELMVGTDNYDGDPPGLKKVEQKTRHHHVLSAGAGMVGQIVGVRIEVTNPADNFRYSGFGVTCVPGVDYRSMEWRFINPG